MDKLTQEVVPILILCTVIALVVRQLPRIDLGHTAAFRRRPMAGESETDRVLTRDSES